MKALIVVQIFVQHPDGVLPAGPGPGDAAGRFVAHPLERVEIAARIERRIFDPGDRERGGREVVAGRVHRPFEVGGDLNAARLQVERVFHWGDCIWSAVRGSGTGLGAAAGHSRPPNANGLLSRLGHITEQATENPPAA